jgi:HlyD family secretion protein
MNSERFDVNTIQIDGTLRRIQSALLVTGILFSSGALVACSQGSANESMGVLQTATVAKQTIVSSVDATGTIEPIRIIEVKSQAGGEILELPVELGDYVEQGTLLSRIDPRDVRNTFEQAQADFDVAEARFEVAERQLSRISELHDSDIVTDEELEAAMLEHANARAARVRAATNLELAEDKLDDVTLRAPISGTIVERSIEQGQVITGTRDLTGGTVLMRMADLQQVQVRTLVDETDIGKLEPGLPANITVEAYPEQTFRGTVLKIEPQAVVEQNVTMFAVLTRIMNEEDLLRPGMNADVEIVVGRESDVLSLPNSAVKMPDEARQLAVALDLEMPEPGATPPGGPPGGPGGDGAEAEGEAPGAADQAGGSGAAAAAEEEEKIGGIPVSQLESRIRSMSDNERRDFFMNMSAGDRQRMMQLMQQRQQEQEQADRSNPGRPRDAFVFVADAAGALTIHPITIGLSNYDFTQVLAGVEEGDVVVSIPLSIIQQRQLLDRIRSRSSIPGVQRSN